MRAVPPLTLTVLTGRLFRCSLSTETIPARKINGSGGSRSSSISHRRLKSSARKSSRPRSSGEEAIPPVGGQRPCEHRVADWVEDVLESTQELAVDLLDRLPDGERAKYQGDDGGRHEGAADEAQHGRKYLLFAEECGDDDQDQADDECERVGQEHRSPNPDGR